MPSNESTRNNLRQQITEMIRDAAGGGEAAEVLNMVREVLHELSDHAGEPVDCVRWIPIEQVTPNDYNPNSVATEEMKLLYTSIHHDGYTQPVVTIYDPVSGRYVIVDGFHRYYVLKTHADLLKRTGGRLPVVVIDKGIGDRMASTVRHNRARGTHSVDGMSGLVFALLNEGWKDADICNEVGLTPEELLRLKHITGFSALFKNHKYSASWVGEKQIQISAAYRAEQAKKKAEAPRKK